MRPRTATARRGIRPLDWDPTPPTTPDELKPRLERDHAELIADIAQAELERFALPEEPATDEECAQLTEFVVKLKGLAKRLEDQRRPRAGLTSTASGW
jgi:hypothetical protein